MSTIKFPSAGTVPLVSSVKPATATAAETSAAPQVDPTPTSSAVPAVYQPVAAPPARPMYYDDEDVDARDLRLPPVNMVQKSGELSTIFSPGTLLLDKSLVLAPAPDKFAVGKSIKLLVIGFTDKKFVEKVQGEGGEAGLRGNTFTTLEEVAQHNGTTDYNEARATGRTLYQTMVSALVLLEQPEGCQPEMFPNEWDGKRYALALYTMKGTSYTNAAKVFMTARKIGSLRGGYRTGWWNFSAQQKKNQNSYYYAPVVSPAGPSSATVQANLTELLGF